MIVTIIGARPQFVKAAVVSIALEKAGIKECLVHTGQHYDDDMSKVFWDELGLPEWELNLMVGSGSHGKQTAAMIEKLEEFLISRQQEIKGIMVYGDTNSTLAAAVAASKLHIPIIHVEAGLRSFNRKMPEEINRIVTDHLSQLLFCSSDAGKEQLAKEGITSGVHVVGDVMFDAVDRFAGLATSKINFRELFPGINGFSLLTVHRPVNTDNDQNLSAILDAIGQLGQTVLWPVHPRTKKQLEGKKLPGNLLVSKPLSYFEMMAALHNCNKVLTDSGGLQKEAYWCRKPCITLRDETEWVETLENNWNILTGAHTDRIVQAFNHNVANTTWKQMYGDGAAADRIASIIKSTLG